LQNPLPRFGLIGTGVWAKMIYAPVAARSTAVQFTSVHGRNFDAAAELAAAYGAMPYSDLYAFLDSVDIVGVCLPPDVQARFALKAAAAGKHLILEKPLSLDPGESTAIADALESQELRSAVFFTRLFLPEVAAWVRQVRTATWFYAHSHNFSRLLLDPSNPFNGTPWRHEVGSLWDAGPHAVALLQSSLGDVAEVVAARGVGDLVTMTLTHRSGAISTISNSYNTPQGFPGEIVLFGESGRETPPALKGKEGQSEAFDIALRMIAVPGASADTMPDARFGSKVTGVLAAAERSVREGRSVKLGS
jgi:predicted dehydrogenase